MKSRFEHGATIETLTPAELRATLTETTAGWFQEMARGLSTARYATTAPVAGAAVTLPATGRDPIGPRQGYAWAVQRISAYGLAAADVLRVYRGAPGAESYIGQVTLSAPLFPGGKALILRGDEKLVLTGSGLTATGDISVNGEVIELPESDLYKIL